MTFLSSTANHCYPQLLSLFTLTHWKRYTTLNITIICHFMVFISAARASLNILFFSRLSLAFFLFSCFLCMDSIFFLMISLSSPLHAISTFPLRISRARFRFVSTDLVWWHWGNKRRNGDNKPARPRKASDVHSQYQRPMHRRPCTDNRDLHTFTTIPVGMCLSTTQLLVLFVACPPGPDPRTNCSSRSSSFRTGRSMRSFFPAAKTHAGPATGATLRRGALVRDLPHGIHLDAEYTELISSSTEPIAAGQILLTLNMMWKHNIYNTWRVWGPQIIKDVNRISGRLPTRQPIGRQNVLVFFFFSFFIWMPG